MAGILEHRRARPSPNRIDARLTDELFESNVEVLTRIARRYMVRERRDHIFEPEALVNEAYVRVAKRGLVRWANKEHFVRDVSREMGRVLIDLARKQNADKNGGRLMHLEFDEAIQCRTGDTFQPGTLRDAMMVFKKSHPRAFLSVLLRSVVGLSVPETARVTGYSERTVKRDWCVARRWLSSELAGSGTFNDKV